MSKRRASSRKNLVEWAALLVLLVLDRDSPSFFSLSLKILSFLNFRTFAVLDRLQRTMAMATVHDVGLRHFVRRSGSHHQRLLHGHRQHHLGKK